MSIKMLVVNVKELQKQIDCRSNLAHAISLLDAENHHLITSASEDITKIKTQKDIIRQLKDSFNDLK